ncbi:MAG: hypothetical protein GF329_05500 [Candidatus Lokiarchaeota archaeon]|nr:hypothetical protein [Candidatus Lokiarchaeota archaeon]
MNKNVFTILVLAFFILTAFAPSGTCDEEITYYVDATNGDDANSGTSPGGAWKSIFKVNNYDFNPGDSILFKRGEVWREKLTITNSGTSSDPITYGAYGAGAKPMLLGSAERNAESDWVNTGSNIWATVIHRDGNELLPNPSFDEDTDGWAFSASGSADAAFYRDAETYDSSPAGARIDCVNNGQGGEGSNIFLRTGGFDIAEGEWYVLSFKAKASTSFELYKPSLVKSGGGGYASLGSRFNMPVGTEWATYNVFYRTDATASDGQISLGLGNIPNGATLYMDDFSLQKCSKIPLAADVGVLIFNEEESVGVKVDYEEDLDTQGDFWYDPLTGRVKMYSTSNPASHYSDIECAIGAFSSDTRGIEGAVISIYADYVTVENLDLRYGGTDGIWVEYVKGVTIKSCDISYCGGNYQGTDSKIRKGDGIAFWETHQDCLVEGCKIGEIYDVGVTSQGLGEISTMSNISYRNNIFWNCEWSFTFFDGPESSVMQSIRFENNTCIGAGFGWGHEQRSDFHGGQHICMKGNTAIADGIYIKNNVFYEASNNCFYLCDDIWTDGVHSEAWSDLTNFEMDNNYYYQSSGYMIVYPGSGEYEEEEYTMSEFSEYQDFTGHDVHSITSDKTLVQDTARSKVPTEDVTFLNELFQQADETALDYSTKEEDSNGTPGFELLLLISALAILVFWKKKKQD